MVWVGEEIGREEEGKESTGFEADTHRNGRMGVGWIELGVYWSRVRDGSRKDQGAWIGSYWCWDECFSSFPSMLVLQLSGIKVGGGADRKGTLS
jgi:hypothetical protein